ncbi:MAG: phage portal protein [Bacteroidales bacterium]|nr:phage portal protein [Bacteroidales bacterium]
MKNRNINRTDNVQKIMNKGYSHSGASMSKRALKGFNVTSGSPNEDINYNNSTLRQRSRILLTSGGLALSAIKTNRTNVVGIGLYPKSRIDRDYLRMTTEEAEAWQKNTEREFSLWAKRKRACDATGLNDFYEMQSLAFIAWLSSGDSFCLFKRYEATPIFPYSLRLHIIEADRISTPGSLAGKVTKITDGVAENGNKIFDGVEVDKNGLVQAYHIRNNYPGETNSLKTEWKRVEAYGKETGLPNILQIMNSERPDQYRGVPYLASVIEPILQTRRYTESELMAAIVESFYTAFITTDTEADAMPFNETIADDQESVSDDENEYEMGPGTTVNLKPGENVVFGDPKRPSGGFEAFIRAISVQIGAALEIPADLLLKEFNASYSASRAALLEAWKAFRTRRTWFVSDFCNPVYEAWMYEAVALGRIQAPGFFDDPLARQAYLGCTWIGPSQGMLDPTKEISAEVMACQYGLSTYSDSATRLNGSDWDANIERLRNENQKLAETCVQNPAIQELIKESIKEGVKTEGKNNANDSAKQQGE